MQRTMMNVTGGILLFGLLTLFGVMVWGRSPQVAATLQSSLPTVVADPIPDAPCLTATDAGFVFDFYGYVHNEDGTTALTYRVTNPNKKDISYVAFGTADWTRVEPSDGMTMTLTLGTYQVEWTNDRGNPGFVSVKYETQFAGYSKGADETFTLMVSDFDPDATVQIEAKAGRDRGRVSFALGDPACDKTPPTPTPTPPFSPLPTPTPTPEGGVVLPTEPVVAECVFAPPAGVLPPEEPIIPLNAYSFSEPQLVITNTAPIEIHQWLPDDEALLVERYTDVATTLDMLNISSGTIQKLIGPYPSIIAPRWLKQDRTLVWMQLNSAQSQSVPGYQLLSFYPKGSRRLSADGQVAGSIPHDSSSDGERFAFMSLPGGTQPLIWNQQTKKLHYLPIDLSTWRYQDGQLYPLRPFNVAWQPDGDKILFWDGTWVFLYDVATSYGCEIKVSTLTKYQLYRYIREVRWSPNGRYLLLKNAEYPPYVSLSGPHDLVLVLDTYTGKSVQYTLGYTIRNFTWAPDNQTVAMTGLTNEKIGNFDSDGYFLLNVRSGEFKRILQEHKTLIGKGNMIEWSTNGDRLAIQCMDSLRETSGGTFDRVCVSNVTTAQ